LAATPVTSDGAPAPVVALPEPLEPELPLPPSPDPKGKVLPPLDPEPLDPFDGLWAEAVVSVGQVACPMVAPSSRATTATREAMTATWPLWLAGFAEVGGGVG